MITLSSTAALARLTPGFRRASSISHWLSRLLRSSPVVTRSGMISSAIESGTQNSGTISAIEPVEASRRDAHHGVALAIERDLAVENVWIGIEAAVPKFVAEHNDAIAAYGLVILVGDGTAQGHGQAEDGEEVSADGLAPDALRRALAADAGRNEGEVRGNATLKDVFGLVAIVEVVGIGVGVAFRKHDHAARIGNGRTPHSSPLATLKTVALAANPRAMEVITTREKPGLSARFGTHNEIL